MRCSGESVVLVYGRVALIPPGQSREAIHVG